MIRKVLPQRNSGVVALDLCFQCQGIWFDQFESVQISPGGIIDLFKLIHAHRDEQRTPLAAKLHCPRCKDPLLGSLDIARGGRFNYHRCLQNHGRFTAFAQFMIEKGFVRQLVPAEVKALAARIGSVHCTGCGAPVDIRTDASCKQCKAPISILDPAAVEKALSEYQHNEKPPANRDPEALAEAILTAEKQRHRDFASGTNINIADLIMSGLGIARDIFER